MSAAGEPLRWAMVGGGTDAFIGAVHRLAARLDGHYRLVAGALSSTPERSNRSGEALGLERVYPDYQALIRGELSLPEGERVQVVSVVTPNDLHYPVALACVEAGFHVICDKPLTHTLAQARELEAAAARAGTVFAVTYNYSGYPLVRQMRQMVREGQLGTLRRITAEYHQGWLAQEADAGNKQAAWRTDPSRSGPAGALGDIGTHAEQLLRYVTGLELEGLCAELSTFVPGRRLDDDVAVLLRFRAVGEGPGARGLLTASQVEVGRENDLRLSVHGEAGSLHWRQEEPNTLVWDRLEQPRTLLTRGGPGLGAAARAATRLPPGHPEAFIEAFANVYVGAAAAIRGEAGAEYPTIRDGVQGVQFVEDVIRSSREGGWVSTGG